MKNTIEKLTDGTLENPDYDKAVLDTWTDYYNKDNLDWYAPASVLLENGFVRASGPAVITDMFSMLPPMIEAQTGMFVSYRLALGADVEVIKDHVLELIEDVYQIIMNNDKWLPADIFRDQMKTVIETVPEDSGVTFDNDLDYWDPNNTKHRKQASQMLAEGKVKEVAPVLFGDFGNMFEQQVRLSFAVYFAIYKGVKKYEKQKGEPYNRKQRLLERIALLFDEVDKYAKEELTYGKITSPRSAWTVIMQKFDLFDI